MMLEKDGTTRRAVDLRFARAAAHRVESDVNEGKDKALSNQGDRTIVMVLADESAGTETFRVGSSQVLDPIQKRGSLRDGFEQHT